MKVTSFIAAVTLEEGLKKSVNNAQVSEIVKIINKKLGGKLYKDIRSLPESK